VVLHSVIINQVATGTGRKGLEGGDKKKVVLVVEVVLVEDVKATFIISTTFTNYFNHYNQYNYSNFYTNTTQSTNPC
jgi:hypothetical protein